MDSIEASQESEPTKESLEAEVERRLAERRKNFSATTQESNTWRTGFESALYRQWGQAFDLLDFIINMCRNIGVTMYNKDRESAKNEGDDFFLALSAIQARACVVAGGILALLRAGYPQDAFARWRTMYELGCVAMFLRKHGQSVAEQYLAHDVIETLKLAEQVEANHIHFGEPSPYSAETMKAMQARNDELVQKYGKDFAKPYGWVASTLHSKRPTFETIEEAVDLSHRRHFYKIASYGIHSDYKGSTLNISLPVSRPTQLYGQSGFGLADAGAGTLEMLNLCTILFMNTRKSWEVGITMRVLAGIVRDGEEVFQRIHAKASEAVEKHQSS